MQSWVSKGQQENLDCYAHSCDANGQLLLQVRPSCDYCLHQKYNVCEYVQDNWFVLSAILKDQYGLVMEEDYCQRHASILSRRQNLHICLSKPEACRPAF